MSPPLNLGGGRHAERKRLEEEERQRLAEIERQRQELLGQLLEAEAERVGAEK